MSSIPDFVAHTPPPNDRERWHELKEHLTDVANGTAEFASKLGAERLGYYAGLSCLIDADRLDTEKFANPEQFQQRQHRANSVSVAQLWEVFQQKQQDFIADPDRSPSKINPKVGQVRAEVYQKCLEAAIWEAGVFRLCVPTGGGKTRSGLAFALKHAVEKKLKDGQKSRVIFAVPYTSIIEQTAKVYRQEIFGDLAESAVLEHHSAIQF